MMVRSRNKHSQKGKHSETHFFDPTLSIQHLKALGDWIGEVIARQYDQAKEALYQMKDDVGERLRDFQDEYDQIQHPKEKLIIKAPLVTQAFFETLDTNKQSEYSDEAPPLFCGLDCSLFKMR